MTLPYTCTLAELVDNLHTYMAVSMTEPAISKGFTIGRGKQLFWYINPVPASGLYKVYPSLPNGNVGIPRYVDAEKTTVTIHPL